MNTKLLPKLSRILNIMRMNLIGARIYGPVSSELYIKAFMKVPTLSPVFTKYSYADLKLELRGNSIIHAKLISTESLSQQFWIEVQNQLSATELHILLDIMGKTSLNYLKKKGILKYKGCFIGDGKVLYLC